MAAGLPSDAVLDILSRMPVKSLFRFRCVCKLWCSYIDDPYLAMIHDKLAVEEPMLLMNKSSTVNNPDRMPLIHIIRHYPHIKSKSRFLKRLFNALSYEPRIDFEVRNCQNLKNSYHTLSKLYEPIDRFRGSCKGLLLLGSRGDYSRSSTNFVVIHPLRKQLYELPPLFHRLDYPNRQNKLFCGLGFDTSTNTFKVVCVEPSENAFLPLKYELNTEDLRPIVHVLGTNTWKGTPNVPYYCWTEPGVFVHGCLHWLVHYTLTTEVLVFDVKTEEFGFIDPPKQLPGSHGYLVDLCGELGYVYNNLDCNMIEVWVLKKKNKAAEWVMHCRIRNKSGLQINVVGCLNKDGDILLTTERWKIRLLVYNLKSGTLQKAGWICGDVDDIQMYRGSLFSINGAYSKSY